LVFILPIWLFYLRNVYLTLALLIATLLLLSITPGLAQEWLDPRFFRLAMPQLLVLAGLISIALNSKLKVTSEKEQKPFAGCKDNRSKIEKR